MLLFGESVKGILSQIVQRNQGLVIANANRIAIVSPMSVFDKVKPADAGAEASPDAKGQLSPEDQQKVEKTGALMQELKGTKNFNPENLKKLTAEADKPTTENIALVSRRIEGVAKTMKGINALSDVSDDLKARAGEMACAYYQEMSADYPNDSQGFSHYAEEWTTDIHEDQYADHEASDVLERAWKVE